MITPEKYNNRPERNCVKCGVLFSGFRCGACQKNRKKEYTEKNRRRINQYNSEWAKQNPEKIKIYAKQWRDNHPERAKEYAKISRTNRADKRKIECKEWKLNNPDKVKKQWVDWRLKNSEKLQNYRKEYSEKFPEVVRARKHSRRVKETSLVKKINPEYIQTLMSNQKMKCVYCEQMMLKYQVDHIVPISRGGDNSNSNLQLLCPTCNRRKGNKTDSEYREYLNATNK